jgi:hypothetical protein
MKLFMGPRESFKFMRKGLHQIPQVSATERAKTEADAARNIDIDFHRNRLNQGLIFGSDTARLKQKTHSYGGPSD